MTSRVLWQIVAASAAVTAVPLACWQYQRYNERKERRKAIKLLRKVELVAAEVAVRLMHVETQAKELVAYEAKKESGETEEDEESPANSSLNSYYHFDSKGNKLKTKWDSYDVDAELERLEKEEQGEVVSTVKTASKKRKVPQASRSTLLANSMGIEHEFEAVLSFLDDIRGDDEVKQLRKSIASKVTKYYFARIDAIREFLA